MFPSIRFGADWTLARLRNTALYCLRHIVQCQLLASLASRASSWRSTAISAEVNRSGKIQKAVALVLCQLRWRQLHRLLRELDAAALSVAPNPAAAERDIRRARRAAHRELPTTTPQPSPISPRQRISKAARARPAIFSNAASLSLSCSSRRSGHPARARRADPVAALPRRSLAAWSRRRSDAGGRLDPAAGKFLRMCRICRASAASTAAAATIISARAAPACRRLARGCLARGDRHRAPAAIRAIPAGKGRPSRRQRNAPRAAVLHRRLRGGDTGRQVRLRDDGGASRQSRCRHGRPSRRSAIEEVRRDLQCPRLTRTINAWEGRWPLTTYRNRTPASPASRRSNGSPRPRR